MLLLKKEDIEKVFTIKDAIATDKEAFRIVTENTCTVPLRTNIPVEKYQGSMLFMPAYMEDMDTAVLKIINLFPQNIDKGLPSSPAQLVVVDGKTGIVSCIMDGAYVTQLRTGAASGAAFDILAKKECKTGALIGTGGQAAAQLEAMLTVRDLEEVRVYDLNPERTKQFAEQMQEKLASYHVRIVPAESSDEAVKDADLLITVTPSPVPVFDAGKIKKGATVSCVGSYQPTMQEMDPQLLVKADKIYFDSEEAVLAESGDIINPLHQKLITENDLTGDLGNVLKGELTGRENDEEIIVFKTVGVATQDLLAAREIYQRAVEKKIGTE